MAFELTDQVEKHLVNDQIVWLTTITSAGRPAPRPVWFVWDGKAVVIYSLPDAVKFKHIAANDQVSLNFNCTPGGGDVVVLSGRAEVPEDLPLPSQFPGLLGKYLEAIEAMGYTQDWYDTYDRAIRVIPDRAWAIPE
jgi:PPOX class probable F420-dependent enzyme